MTHHEGGHELAMSARYPDELMPCVLGLEVVDDCGARDVAGEGIIGKFSIYHKWSTLRVAGEKDAPGGDIGCDRRPTRVTASGSSMIGSKPPGALLRSTVAWGFGTIEHSARSSKADGRRDPRDVP